MTHIQALRTAVERLEATYERERERLIRDYPHCEPEDIQTPDGRFVVLDALTAIVSARTALAAAEAS